MAYQLQEYNQTLAQQLFHLGCNEDKQNLDQYSNQVIDLFNDEITSFKLSQRDWKPLQVLKDMSCFFIRQSVSSLCQKL